MANVLGPVIGGWIVLHASWRWVFFVNVPVGLVAVALLLASYRDPPRARRSPPFAATLREPAVRAGLVASVFAGGILYACAAYVPLWMTGQSHGDALEAGAALVPLLVGWAFGSSFGVRVLVARGMRASVGGGFAIALVGAAALALSVARGLPGLWPMAALAVLGLGLGPAASTSLVGPQSCVPWSHRGSVTSVVYAAGPRTRRASRASRWWRCSRWPPSSPRRSPRPACCAWTRGSRRRRSDWWARTGQ
jgi:predicted MFS family arabinose efflux permease